MKYMKEMFSKEYDEKQILLFGLSMDDLIYAFLNKIFDTKIIISG